MNKPWPWSLTASEIKRGMILFWHPHLNCMCAIVSSYQYLFCFSNVRKIIGKNTAYKLLRLGIFEVKQIITTPIIDEKVFNMDMGIVKYEITDKLCLDKLRYLARITNENYNILYNL